MEHETPLLTRTQRYFLEWESAKSAQKGTTLLKPLAGKPTG